jgi:A/G-specific adenine glycosylase
VVLTAGAVASIAFGAPVPAVDGNVRRVLARLYDLEQPADRTLRELAGSLLPSDRPGDFNQALMELGSLVCTPVAPKCSKCPLASLCAAFAAGLQQEIPPAKAPRQYTELREAAVVIRKKRRVLVRRCGEGERWSGLWDFPRFTLQAERPLFAGEEIVTKVRDQTGVTCAPGPLLKTIKHGVTRYRITLDCYRAVYQSGRARSSNGSPARWIPLAEMADYPLGIVKLLPYKAHLALDGGEPRRASRTACSANWAPIRRR